MMKQFKAILKEQQLLSESIVVSGDALVAYCIVVAEEYAKLPLAQPEELYRWEAMVNHNEKMLPHLLSGVKIEYTEKDPYKNQREMMLDIILNKRLRIFKTPAPEGQHPSIKNIDNDKFRAGHDYIGHFLPNQKEFKQFLRDNGIKDNHDGRLDDYRFKHHSFTVRGEMNTYLTHAKMLPPEAVPALFTEIIGQICTYFVTGNYTVNKGSVIKGIDFKNVGMFTDPKLEARKMVYIKLLSNPSIHSIPTDLGINIEKRAIRWNLLSRGEGQKHKK